MHSIIKEKIENAARDAGYKIPAVFSLDQPPKKEMGDWATNIALSIAGFAKLNPREVAAKIRDELELLGEVLSVEIAGPGFINIKLKLETYTNELKRIFVEKEKYGSGGGVQHKKINVEYISANPTGPLHVGNARGGPIGEMIANLYQFLGCDVSREFYINDIGGQANRFGASLFYWHELKENKNAEFPEGGYPAAYVKEISIRISDKYAEMIDKIVSRSLKVNFFRDKGIEEIVSEIKTDSALLDIKFNRWFYQSELEKNNQTAKVVETLKLNGATVIKDGALWFKDPADVELKDRESVLVKQDGSYTYFADDIAYHKNKIERGFEGMVDVWGANHFGHVPRLKAALSALGYSESILNIVLYQYIRLKKSGAAVSMGKRLGNFITLREVIEAGVKPDAYKYFILSQNLNTPFDFDIELAADTSEKNPVFYIKYAHARISSILKRAKESGVVQSDSGSLNLTVFENDKEIALLKEIIKFPDIIADIAENFQLQALPHFAYKVANLFHDFYNSCQVLGQEQEVLQARLALATATKTVIKNSLSIMGIDAPEKM